MHRSSNASIIRCGQALLSLIRDICGPGARQPSGADSDIHSSNERFFLSEDTELNVNSYQRKLVKACNSLAGLVRSVVQAVSFLVLIVLFPQTVSVQGHEEWLDSLLDAGLLLVLLDGCRTVCETAASCINTLEKILQILPVRQLVL